MDWILLCWFFFWTLDLVIRFISDIDRGSFREDKVVDQRYRIRAFRLGYWILKIGID